MADVLLVSLLLVSLLLVSVVLVSVEVKDMLVSVPGRIYKQEANRTRRTSQPSAQHMMVKPKP